MICLEEDEYSFHGMRATGLRDPQKRIQVTSTTQNLLSVLA